MFDKILIANRGEIAVRVARTAREMGIATVAVYSEPDREALHVRMADEAYFVGPASPSQSYLDGDNLIAVALRAGAQAIHPGYGFLAENAGFARDVVSAGLTWIGPHADAIDAMGDKLRARKAMKKARVPVVPGGIEPVADASAARRAAKSYGLPLALKAAGGGGGKGLKVAHTLEEVDSAFYTARREAETYFKNGTIYAERYLENPKHIELQILADKHGNVVHVGERDCSLQRRHQKLWEETPVALAPALRRKMRAAALRAAQAIRYDSVGTIECLVAGDAFYFLEMNTRIQVEHTVTEMISGLDLIREQIRVAFGEPLGLRQDDITFTGAAIEGRVNAEDPARDFHPAPGTITAYREPGGLGVRVDSAAFAGWTISPDYDSLVAKLVVWAPNRAQAIARLRRALDEYSIEGVPTTVPLLRALCDHPPVIDGTYGTSTLEAFAQSDRPSTAALRASAQDDTAGGFARPSTAALRASAQDDTAGGFARPSTAALRASAQDDTAGGFARPSTAALRASAQDDTAGGFARPSTAALRASAQGDTAGGASARDVIRIEVNDRLYRVRLIDVPRPAGNDVIARRRAPRLNAAKGSHAKTGGDDVISPMHGIIVEINAAEGDAVSEGQVVAVVEAMKMMNEIRAHRSGTVTRVHGAVGDAVESGSPLVSIA